MSGIQASGGTLRCCDDHWGTRSSTPAASARAPTAAHARAERQREKAAAVERRNNEILRQAQMEQRSTAPRAWAGARAVGDLVAPHIWCLRGPWPDAPPSPCRRIRAWRLRSASRCLHSRSPFFTSWVVVGRIPRPGGRCRLLSACFPACPVGLRPSGCSSERMGGLSRPPGSSPSWFARDLVDGQGHDVAPRIAALAGVRNLIASSFSKWTPCTFPAKFAVSGVINTGIANW